MIYLGNIDKKTDQMEEVSHELFEKLSCYLQAELSGTKDTYSLLEVCKYFNYPTVTYFRVWALFIDDTANNFS